ncbi:mitogen-activated protein kinase kinase kinase 20-like [Amphiura filiformis]|uniref:mitogen-activated protein kinase kinase kinase 20-like n=1 Tax=Amphiura filiformis TaxID=82378 RepID=UPI003B21156F
MARSSRLHSTISETDIAYHEFIDRGSSGDVYRAYWNSPDLSEIEVAAKKIPLRKDQSIEDQLGNEINFLQKLEHPNIIKYYGQIITGNYVVIVTEYAAKGSLYDYLKCQSSIPSALKLKWAIQAARGIRYLQENKVLHRDIKSPNFLITADYNLKICDFGIAKDLTSTRTTVTSRGTIKWLAPEVFTEEKLSPTADIFMYGIVLWELETCEEPYDGISPERVMWRVGTEGLRPTIPATCPATMSDLIQRCWDDKRYKRPKVDEIIEQLERVST